MTTAPELSTDLLRTLRARMWTLSGGTTHSQEVLILGLASMLGEMLATTAVEPKGPLLREVLRVVGSSIAMKVDIDLPADHDGTGD